MSAVARNFLNSLRKVKNVYLDTHEDFGRMNTTRLVIATYIGIFCAVKWNGKRKEKAIQQEKLREKENVLTDALARAGI